MTQTALASIFDADILKSPVDSCGRADGDILNLETRCGLQGLSKELSVSNRESGNYKQIPKCPWA